MSNQSAKIVKFDVLRSIAYTSITTSYAALGTPMTVNPRILIITNTTKGDMLISDDGVNDKLFIAAGSFKLLDLTANMDPNKDDSFVVGIGVQFYVKYATSPTSGAVYLENIYA